MAGLGFKDFAVGEVLTSADVDGYLMQQTVMRFADSAARGSAIGTAVLSEGMVSYLQDTDAVEVYDGSAWTALSNAGIGSNVVQTVKTDTYSLSSATFTSVTGLSVTITPTLNTSKILIIANVAFASSANISAFLRLSGGNSATYIGDASGARSQVAAHYRDDITLAMSNATLTYLDSPATTSPVTYEVEIARGGATPSGTVFVNRISQDDNNSDIPRAASSITAIEVAA